MSKTAICRAPLNSFEAAKELLGAPYCSGERFAIYHLDCREGMAALATNVVDLTITSPPYNIGKEYEEVRPLEEYISWCESWLNDIHRVTSETGALWLNLGYVSIPDVGKAVPLPYLLWGKSPFYLMQELVWNYGAGVAARKFLSPRNEKFLWYVKNKDSYTFNLDEIRDPDVKYPNQKKNGKLRCNTAGKNPSDVWTIAKVTSGKNRSSKERAPHPAQFPMDLVTRLVKGFSNGGDLVLDPFSGSGTTVDCAVRNGRFAIGFEINEHYCEYSAERLEIAEREIASNLF